MSMSDDEFCNIMAMLADTESRQTAMLVEMVAAAALMKLQPPARGDDVVSVEISKADLEAVIRDFSYRSAYDADGTMAIFLTPADPVDDHFPDSGQS